MVASSPPALQPICKDPGQRVGSIVRHAPAAKRMCRKWSLAHLLYSLGSLSYDTGSGDVWS
eukprot:4919242-Alexandrium_andersonii.AAC.1